jgi:D-threo-aldose 1-dehydrogenase
MQPLNAIALQFPLAHPAVISIVVGAVSSTEVAANIEALQIPIPPELWADLQAEELLESGAPVPGD